MSESAPPPEAAESVEDTLSEFLDTALAGTGAPEDPDEVAADSGSEGQPLDGD